MLPTGFAEYTICGQAKSKQGCNDNAPKDTL